MIKAKATAGLLVMLGLPALFATIGAALVVFYANQHVHDRSARILNDHAAVVHVRDYHHSTAGIVGFAGGVGIFWVVLTLFFVLAGGSMVDARERKWDA